MSNEEIKPLTLPEGVTIENGAQMFTYLMDTKENNPIVDFISLLCKPLNMVNPFKGANLRNELWKALKFDNETFIGVVEPLFLLFTGKEFDSIFPKIAFTTEISNAVVVHPMYFFEHFYECLNKETDSMDQLLQTSTVLLSTILLISYITALPPEDKCLIGCSFDFEPLTVVRCEGEEENYGIKSDGDKVSIDSNGEWLPCKRPSEAMLALLLVDLGLGVDLGKMSNCEFVKEFIVNAFMAADAFNEVGGEKKEGITLEDFMSATLPSYIRNFVAK